MIAAIIACVAIAFIWRYFQIARQLKLETQRLSEELSQAKQYQEQARKLLQAVESTSSSIIISDLHGKIEYVNPKFSSITGYSFEEVQGKNTRILKSGETPAADYQNLWSTILSGREWHGEFHNRKKNGEFFWELASISPIFNETGKITHFVSVKEDITERKRIERAIEEKTTQLKEANSLLEQSLAQVQELSGLLPMCAWCKKIRDGTDYWYQVEDYISRHTKAHFTHGICPECFEQALMKTGTAKPPVYSD